MARGETISALAGKPRTAMARTPRQGQCRSEVFRLQRALGARQADEPRYSYAGLGAAGTARAARPRHKGPGVLFLSYLLDNQLRRLSPADRSQLEESQPSL